LTAPARTLESALGLLTQVAMDGCVLAQPLAEAAVQELDAAMARYRPESIRVYLPECCGGKLEGWVAAAEADLCEEVWRLYAELPES